MTKNFNTWFSLAIMLIVLYGCSHKLSPPKYYLFNDKAEKYKLRDSVKHLDTIFFDKNNEFLQVGNDFPSRPLHEIFNAGHNFFNDNWQKLERRFFKK